MSWRVLVADDDPDLLETVAAALSAAGATVVRASSGAELLERVAEDGVFDLVITDVSMPWMTGLQVAHSMREVGLAIPLVVMTGVRDSTLPERVRSLGEDVTLLRKPFDLEQLRAAVLLRLPTATWAAAVA